jgi:hypothetical protein
MKIGIIADTHDNLPKIEKAVSLFNKEKVDFVFHAGDFIAPFTIDKLKALSSDWVGVFGNNDGEKNGLSLKSQGRIKEGPLRTVIQDKKITLVHDINTIDIKQEKADLVIFGHTHKPEIIERPHKLIVNPGECSGWLSDKSTVAIVKLDTLKATIIKI